MWKARKDGYSIKVRYGKVLFCGANAAGKTNFLNLLLGEEFNPKHVSTEVAKPQQATVAMKARVSKCDKDGDVIFTKMDIDDEIHQLMTYLPNKYTQLSNRNTKPPKKSAKPHNQQDTAPHDDQDALSDYQQNTTKVQKKDKWYKNVKRKFTENTKSKETKPEFQERRTIAECDISNKLLSRNTLSTLESHVTQRPKEVWDILTFMDTGGQPQYISMLPAINSFAMITFIVHKMTGGKKSLDDKFTVRHGDKKGEHSFTPYKHECTYLQLIKTLMSYASINLFPDKSFLNKFKIPSNQTQSRSISFVGTHSKNVSENDIMEIDKELVSLVTDPRNIRIKLNELYEYLVPIDNKEQNKSSSEKDEISESFKSIDNLHKKYTNPSKIREYIYKWMKMQDIYTVPIQWLLLELEIRKVCESKHCSLITCKDVLRIGREKQLGDDNFIKTGLRFHHLFGVLLYFEKVKGMDELVITDHRWLFDKLSEIVQYSFKPDLAGEEANLSKGIFKEVMLNELNIDEEFKISGINTDSFNPKMAFLDLLQYLLIIARLNDEQYFMPSLLKSSNVIEQQGNIPGKPNFMAITEDSQSLLIQFASDDTDDTDNAPNSFPRGFLCFLVVQLIDSANWKLYKKNAYNNILTFFEVNGGYYVTLVDKIFFLEIIVTHDCSNMLPIHHEVFTTIENAISAIKNKLNIKINLKHGFLCKTCQNTTEAHMTYLSDKSTVCYCVGQQPTRLEKSHEVWLKPSSEVSTIFAQLILHSRLVLHCGTI